MERLGYLDGWRGVAIVCVLVAHFVGVPWLNLGRFGVDLFFVLSGLLMSKLLYEKRTPLPEFYRRRISRIFPAFLAFVLIVFGLGATTGIPSSWTEFFSTLTFTRAYFGGSLWGAPMPTQNLWSLNVEEHAYVLLATLTFIPRRFWLLIGLALCTIVANIYWARAGLPDYEIRTECAATCLLLSAGYRTVAHRFTVPQWAPIAALVLALACYSRGAHWMLRPFVAPFLLAFAVNHIDRSVIAVRALELTWLRQLGIWSFSVYLWQQPFYRAKAFLTAPGALALAMLAGLASFYIIEQPARRWLNGLSRRESPIHEHAIANR